MVVYRIALMEDSWRLLKVGVFDRIQLVGVGTLIQGLYPK